MSSSHKPPAFSAAAQADDDDEWESMPVENAQHTSAAPIPVSAYSNPYDLPYGDEEEDDSDPDDPRRFRSLPSRSSARHKPSRSASGNHHKRSAARSQYLTDNVASSSGPPKNAATNATGKHLDIDDARGYDWRSKPANAQSDQDDDDSDAEKGYTQLRLDEDEEAEELHAATRYLFQDGDPHDPYGDNTTATPLNQMKTTKQLLSEGQKIAYVGLCSLIASEMVRQIRRVPGKNLDPAKQSVDAWKIKVMARLYQHMEIESSEQRMIESLAEHGVLATDLAPSLVTTQTIDNPDFDPDALREKQQEEQEQQEQRQRDQTLTTSKDPPTSPASSPRAGPGTTQLSSSDGADDQRQLSAQRNETDDEDLDGDLGASRPKASETTVKEPTRSAATGVKHASTEDEGFDIGMQLEETSAAHQRQHDFTNREPDAGKSPPISTTSPVIADPNTASQLSKAVDAVDGTPTIPDVEAGPGSVTTALGLTKEPQALEPPPGALDGVTTSISSADATITLDLRWTVLCDLFLVLTADSVYDARSRVLLERVASYLGLTWMDVTQFEKRITDALEIEEGVETLSDQSAIKQRMIMARKKRMVMMGLATVGGGLVIGLSAGLLAPVIGAGMGAALGAVGIGGTSGFLGGVGGAALITSTGTVGGMSLAGRGMSRRTRSVKTFEFKPIHNNKRVNAIVTVPGFMSGPQDDVRLPFSVIDSVMGDAFSVLWEPDMMQEMGNALGLLWNETIVQGVQQALALTVAGAGAMLTALAWPLWLTKLGYLIDNPWSNALDRAQAAGLILADTLSKRQLGVRPITLVGYSLGARVIFYALVELSRIKAYGIVQNVYIMGAPVTAKDETWKEARSVVSGRFVSAFSRSDWILGYLHRAASGGLRSIAGLHPVERVQDIENVDVTHVVPGHLGYRPLMPLVLSELGFRTTADYFDEPEDLNAIPERQIVRDEKPDDLELKPVSTSTGGFGKIFRRKAASSTSSQSATPARSSSAAGSAPTTAAASANAPYDEYDDGDLPPREEHQEEPVPSSGAIRVEEAKQKQEEIVKQSVSRVEAVRASHEGSGRAATPEADRPNSTSAHFDTEAILRELRESGIEVKELESSLPPLPLSAKAESVAVPFPREENNDTQHEQIAPGPSNVVAASASTAAAFGSNPLPEAASVPADGGISLTFASYDDEDIQLAESPSEIAPSKYGLSSSAAAELANRFRNDEAGTTKLAGNGSALRNEVWLVAEDDWGVARPDTSYDISMGTRSAKHSLPTSSSLGFGEMLSPGHEASHDALTPPSLAVGRGFDFTSALGTAPGSSHSERNAFDLSAGAKPSPSGERTQRRGGDGTGLGSEPDPWAENPW
ncbi:transmembrane and coiled-coil domain-containing protein 4 [Pseudozyma hubeiensis SY62]|uniref:Transmembrane and coiled-coil domain-containing protein 4 n=1 Tax=Pseudozyma hubeiensis (strain SY62) TaxID=1305764 RepID=R9P3A3_PSEHS|nr:transmembrane and coiled-coil domain-containing protein 4 [Pseudozyma hubeiensis SY62]GAC95913.1 transmembrane and coiled-coil domain-containing protein 4 [Pseudozyma hubeiensis SY62]